MLLKQIKKKATAHWGKDVKFVFLYWEVPSEENQYYYFYDELTKNGWQCYSVSDITDIDIYEKQYRTEDNHPSARAWEIITPLFVKKTGM